VWSLFIVLGPEGTVLGDEGIIEMCAIARGGKQYLVSLVGGRDVWLYEDRLKSKTPTPTVSGLGV